MNNYFIGISMFVLTALAAGILGLSAYQYHKGSKEMVLGTETLETLIEAQRQSFTTTYYGKSGT